MKTQTEVTQTEVTQINAIELLCKFVAQRPGFDLHNYDSMKSYRQDYSETLKDRNSFYELLNLARTRYDGELNEVLVKYLQQSNDRLTLIEGKEGYRLQYITGQYFATEYRNAACRVLVSIIWNDYRDEKHKDGSNVYNDGHAIRKAIKSNYNIRTRNTKLFFN
jgi:hypothetical protein